MRGYFITFEGLDGSGKTTQIGLLKEYLMQRGYKVLVTREPGGTPIGEDIRQILLDAKYKNEMDYLTEMLLYAASRAQHIKQLIIPALTGGKIVLCDRFVDSSIAYQGAGRGIGTELVEKINEIALQGLVPDLTLFFDIEPEKGLKRSGKRNRKADRLELENLAFYQNVYKGFVDLALQNTRRFRRINANLSIEEVHREIIVQMGNCLCMEDGI